MQQHVINMFPCSAVFYSALFCFIWSCEGWHVIPVSYIHTYFLIVATNTTMTDLWIFFFIVKTSIDLKVCSCVLYATLSQSTFVCLIFHKLLPVLVWNHFYSAIQVLTFKGISSISFSRCWWMPDRNLYLDNSLYHSAKITLLESTLSRVATALLYLTLTWNC